MRNASSNGAAIADLGMGDMPAAAASSGCAPVIFGSFSRRRVRVKAPMLRALSDDKETFDNSVRPFRSINADGAATRKFIIGTKLWPPAIYRAFSPSSCFIAIAFLTLSGARYENFDGFIFWQSSAVVQVVVAAGPCSPLQHFFKIYT